MKVEEVQKKPTLSQVASIKKDLMMLRIKASSGDAVVLKDYKNKKKQVAKLLTKLNQT